MGQGVAIGLERFGHVPLYIWGHTSSPAHLGGGRDDATVRELALPTLGRNKWNHVKRHTTPWPHPTPTISAAEGAEHRYSVHFMHMSGARGDTW